jgi:hypothetical protein
MKKFIVAIISVGLTAGTAFAKLPDLSDEAKVKAAEAKAKAAHGDKVANYQLCQSQNAVAARHKGGGKGAKKVDMPACADPGKFDLAAAMAPPPAAAAPAAPAAAAPAKK